MLTFRNWAGNQLCSPKRIESVSKELDLVRVVQEAASRGERVKAVGAGHSGTPIAMTQGTLVRLDSYGSVLDSDPTGKVTVQSGARLARLSDELDRRGLALPNLGDIAYQSISGAISTGTHGTGERLGNLATFVSGLRMVSAKGEILECSETENADLFRVARVGLGALGLISTVTLRCVPAFRLHAVEEPMRLDGVLERLDELVAENDHFEFFWVPGSRWALTKRNNRTDSPAARRGPLRELYWDILISNVAFGALCEVGKIRPEWIPRLGRLLPRPGRVEYVDRSDRVLASPRWVRFVEMEYAIPREAVVEAVQRVRGFVDASGLIVTFPIEVRFVAPDDIPLSPAYGRKTAYIAVHVVRGMPYVEYFREVERIMNDYDGRPHWGKVHFQSAETLKPRYPEWDRFQEVRARFDPEGRFSNDHLERILGPVQR